LYTPSGTAVFSHLTTSFTVTASTAAPTFALSGPASGTYTAGQTVSVQWTDTNVPSGSKISLAYDTTTNWGNPKWIEIDGVAAASSSGSYSWNTTGLTAGTYYMAGYLYTPSGTAVFSHLTTSFTVTASATAPTFALSGPASGTYTAGQTVSVQWTDTNVPSGSKISLAYDTTTNWGNPKWIEIDGVAAASGSGTYSWNTTGLTAGTYYIGGYLYTPSDTAVFSHLTTSFAVTAAGTLPGGVGIPAMVSASADATTTSSSQTSSTTAQNTSTASSTTATSTTTVTSTVPAQPSIRGTSLASSSDSSTSAASSTSSGLKVLQPSAVDVVLQEL
jgi:hypothetical protein